MRSNIDNSEELIRLSLLDHAAFPSVPALAYDGGTVYVPMEAHDEAVLLLTKHTGWIVQHRFDNVPKDDKNPIIRERKTILGYGTCIQSIHYRENADRLHQEFSAETEVRWCWRTRDIHATRAYLQAEGLETGEVYPGPGHAEYFDFWLLDRRVRLTVQQDAAVGEDEPRLVPSWTRIGVRNVSAARNWYETYVGMRLIEDHTSSGYVIMGLALEHHPDEVSLWVLEQTSVARTTSRQNGAARPACVLHDKHQFAAYHAYLKQQGIETAEIMGYPPIKGYSWFHYYDPDGNRFDVMRY